MDFLIDSGIIFIIPFFFTTFIFILIFGTIISAISKAKKQEQKNHRMQRMQQRVDTTIPLSSTLHEDHTRTIPHDQNRTYRKNHEHDIVKDPPLSEAEKNVLYGRHR